MTKLWPYEIGAKTGDCNDVAKLRTNVATLQIATKTQHPDITTLLHDITTFGVDFGSIFSPF